MHTEQTVARTGFHGIHGSRYRKGKAGAHQGSQCFPPLLYLSGAKLVLNLLRLTSLRVCAGAAQLLFVLWNHLCSLGDHLRRRRNAAEAGEEHSADEQKNRGRGDVPLKCLGVGRSLTAQAHGGAGACFSRCCAA